MRHISVRRAGSLQVGQILAYIVMELFKGVLQEYHKYFLIRSHKCIEVEEMLLTRKKIRITNIHELKIIEERLWH